MRRRDFLRLTAGTLAATTVRPVQATTSSYFAYLSGRPERIVAKDYKSQTQINADSQVSPNSYVTYDSVEDAAKVEFVNDKMLPAVNGIRDASLPNMVTPDLPATYTTGNLLFYAEFKWHSHYANDAYLALDGHGNYHFKWLQLSNRLASGDQRRVEPRTRFDSPANSPYFAWRDVRCYSPGNISNEIRPYTYMLLLPAQWYRWWMYVEFVDADTWRISEWMAVSGQPAVQLTSGFDTDVVTGGGINQFWFEYNSSDGRPDTAGPLISWFRDFVVLRNVAAASVPAIIAASTGTTLLPPSPPNTVRLLP